MPVGDTHERLDDAAPEPDKSILRSQDRHRRPAGTASGSTGAGQQHLLPVFRQRIQVNVLRRPACLRCTRLASLRPANALPVGRTVAGPPVLRRIHKGLRQYRLQAVPLLPVPGQPPNRHRQGLRGQIRNPNPREDQEPGVVHHPFRRFARSRSRQPIQASRQGSRVVPASNSRQPSLRPRRFRSQ